VARAVIYGSGTSALHRTRALKLDALREMALHAEISTARRKAAAFGDFLMFQ
jgi:hypothetical protein